MSERRKFIPMPERGAWESRFWSKTEKLPSGCWEWTGKKDRKGYGRFFQGTSLSYKASRVALYLHTGKDPAS